jgi:hypothetical protein
VRSRLTLHPEGRCEAVTGIEVEASRSAPRLLVLRYVVAGRIGDLGIPAPASPERTDGLWRNTCLEAFLRPEEGAAYYELNLSPSGRWAAYRFSAYRDGMTPAEALATPKIELRREADRLELAATIDLAGLQDLPADGPWRIGLSAVIEEAGGRLSYWALAHPPGRPDFHHPDCFAAELVAPHGR